MRETMFNRIIIISISLLFVVGTFFVPFYYWKEEMFSSNFPIALFGTFASSLFGGVFTYFIVDELNKKKLKNQWKHYEIDIKTKLFRFYQRGFIAILMMQHCSNLLYREHHGELTKNTFDNNIVEDYKDFKPKAQRLKCYLQEYSENPERVKINEVVAKLYATQNKDKYIELKEEVFKYLPLLPWLSDFYLDFLQLENVINHLKLDLEILNGLNNAKKIDLININKAKKQYINNLIRFLEKLAYLNEDYKLHEYSKIKSNFQRKDIKRQYLKFLKRQAKKKCDFAAREVVDLEKIDLLTKTQN